MVGRLARRPTYAEFMLRGLRQQIGKSALAFLLASPPSPITFYEVWLGANDGAGAGAGRSDRPARLARAMDKEDERATLRSTIALQTLDNNADGALSAFA